MGLQASQAHILGRTRKLFVVDETVPGTFVKAVTSSGAHAPTHRNPKVLTASFVPNTKRKPRLDANMASRDVVESITDKTEHSWAVELHYVPSGTKNVAPDCAPFIIGAGFGQSVNANDVSYALHSNQAVSTLSMTQNFSDPVEGSMFQESMAGCVVDSLKMVFAGGEEPKLMASGRAMSYAATGHGTLDAAMADPWTTMLLQPNVDQNDAYVTNASAIGGAGLGARSIVGIAGVVPATDVEVTVDSAATDAVPSFTVSGVGTDQADDAVVTPYVPTHTSAGSPIAGIAGAFLWDSFTARLTGLEFEIKNPMTYNDDEAFASGLTDAIPNMREIIGTMNFRVRQDHLRYILARKSLAVKALSLTIGGLAATGTRLVVSMPYCELDFNEVQAPQTEEATISATFKAKGSAGNDAATLMHT